MRYKHQVKNQAPLDPMPIISDELTLDNKNRDIDEFGEIAVKKLQRPYRINFSEDDIIAIVAAYKVGSSTYDIASIYNCNKNTISSLLKQQGVEVSNRKVQNKLPVNKVIAMYEVEHMKIDEIAHCFEVGASTIRKCLLEHGVKMRTRWDYTNRQ